MAKERGVLNSMNLWDEELRKKGTLVMISGSDGLGALTKDLLRKESLDKTGIMGNTKGNPSR